MPGSGEGMPQPPPVPPKKSFFTDIVNRFNQFRNPAPEITSPSEQPQSNEQAETMSRRSFLQRSAAVTGATMLEGPEDTLNKLFMPSVKTDAETTTEPGTPEIPMETELISAREDTLVLVMDESGNHSWERASAGQQFEIIKDVPPEAVDLGELMTNEARQIFCGYKTKDGKYIAASRSSKAFGGTLPKFDRIDTDQRLSVTAHRNARIMELVKIGDDVAYSRPVTEGDKFEIKKGDAVEGLVKAVGPNKDNMIFIEDPDQLRTFAVSVDSLIDPKSKDPRGEPGIRAVNTDFLYQQRNIVDSDSFTSKLDETYRNDLHQSINKLYETMHGSVNHDVVLHIHPTASDGNGEGQVWTFGDGVIYISKSMAQSAQSSEAGKQKLKLEILKAAVRTNRIPVPNARSAEESGTLAVQESDIGFEQTWDTGSKKKDLSQIFEGYMASMVMGEPQNPGSLEFNQYHFMNALSNKFNIDPYVIAKAYVLNRPYHFIQMLQENAWSGSPQKYENQDELEARFLRCPNQQEIWKQVYLVFENVQMTSPGVKTREDLERSAEDLNTFLEQSVRY